MGNRLTAQQQDFVAALRDFAARECGTREQRAQLTENGATPHNQALYSRMAELGWLGACFPEEDGGAGGGLTEASLLMEGTAYGMVPVGGYVTTAIAAKAYERFGSPEQRRRVVGGAVDGAVASIAMSEPEAGSDVGALQCRAEPLPEDGGWLVNGHKTWISNARLADTILLVARTSPDKHKGLTMFDLPADAPGVSIHGIDTMGAARSTTST